MVKSNAFYSLRMARAINPLIATWGTSLVSLLVLPLVDVIFSVYFGYQLSDATFSEMLIAATLTTTMISAINGSAQSVVRDYNLGILTHILTLNPNNTTYWFYIVGLPAVLSCIPSIVAFLFWILLFPYASHIFTGTFFGMLLLLFLCAASIGSSLGTLIALISTSKKNPYIYTNMLVSFFPLLVGTLLPLSAYPQILQHIATLIPGSGLVIWGRMLVQETYSIYPCIQTILSSTIWIVMLLLLFKRYMTHMHHGISHGMM